MWAGLLLQSSHNGGDLLTKQFGAKSQARTRGTQPCFGEAVRSSRPPRLQWRLKYCTALSCFFAAPRVLNVPRFLRFPVFGFFFLEYNRYPDLSFLIIIMRSLSFLRLVNEDATPQTSRPPVARAKTLNRHKCPSPRRHLTNDVCRQPNTLDRESL